MAMMAGETHSPSNLGGVSNSLPSLNTSDLSSGENSDVDDPSTGRSDEPHNQRSSTPPSSIRSDEAAGVGYQSFDRSSWVNDNITFIESKLSDESSEVDEPAPISLQVKDEKAYEHLHKNLVVDGVTRRAVTDNTNLAALYQYDNPTLDNDLIRSLAGEVEPAVRVQLETADGRLFPPTAEVNHRHYQIKLTWTNLMLAPAVRLICQFKKPSKAPYLTLKVDFHFGNHREGEDNEISNYSHVGTTITFHAGRATSSGFNRIPQCGELLGQEEQDVINALAPFIATGGRHQLKLLLMGHNLKPEDFRHLNKVRARLPGGNGPLLGSLTRPEYAAFGGKGDHIPVYNGSMLRPGKLMSDGAPLPMVPLPAEATFGSLREATAQLAWSATVADEEAREALRLWSAVKHDARLYLNHEFPVLALYFRDFDKLGGRVRDPKLDTQFRLPREMNCTFTIRDDADVYNQRQFEGFLLGSDPGVIAEDVGKPSAMFRVTSPRKEDLTRMFYDRAYITFPLGCSPHISSFTYTQQLEAVRMLQGQKNSRWWPILLNQNHGQLQWENPTAGVSETLKTRADNWLRNWQVWNPEQRAVIDSITRAKGGMTVVMGPAATGKTLLQRGIAIYFYSLGYHILALAPANDNVNKLAKDLVNVKAGLPDWINLEFNRLFPSSRDIPIDEMTAKQADLRKVGHEGGAVLPFTELLSKLDEDRSVRGAHRTYGIVETIIRIAEEKSLTLRKAFKEGEVALSPGVNAWDILRELIAAYRDDKLNHADQTRMGVYRVAYQACKAQVVGLNRFMITTTGNVRASEMRDHWFSPQEDYGVPRKGVVILVDEAAKDVEVNIWSAIVSGRWSEYVKGVWLFGDDKQLQPTNTSAKGNVQFNYFSDRLDMPLPNRLVQEGFPCFRLFEQRRMHEAISQFPNRIIYEGLLRDGPGMDVSLNTHMPGLRQVLIDIITSGRVPTGAHGKVFRTLKDNDLRRHYFEVKGQRVEFERSLAVLEHIDVFMEKIFPKLFDFFKASDRSMKEEVMIICAYNYARSEYDRRIREFLRQRPGCTTLDIPRILSVDSSQGDEAFMVFFDASAQFGDKVGFMANPNRFNVAVTRAKGVFWMIGGTMKVRNPLREPNLITQYKRELNDANQVRIFEAPKKHVYE